MAKVTVMSYKDTNAPQIIANNRTALYDLLDTWMTTGYNQKFVRNLYTQPDRTIVLEYSEPHGYKTGHLLKITGATDPKFNAKFRCIKVTADTVTLRIDQADTSTYPLTDASSAIQSVVSPADWNKVYTSATQRTYQSKNTTTSSQVFWTVRQPDNVALRTTGAVCYSVDISPLFDTATGTPLNSYLDSQKTSTYGTNYYILSDFAAYALPTTTNGRAGTWLPWFVVATDTFVYFMLGAEVYSNGIITDPNTDGSTVLGYRDYYRYYNSSTYAQKHMSYFIGDIEAYNPIEYTNKTSVIFSFTKVSTTGVCTNYRAMPARSNTTSDSGNDMYLIDAYLPQGSIKKVHLGASGTNVGGTFSGGTDKYFPYPMLNVTGLLTSLFYVSHETTTATNNIDNCHRGLLPNCFRYVMNYYTLPNDLRDVEGNPFILEPTGSVYDQLIVIFSDGFTTSPGNSVTSTGGFKPISIGSMEESAGRFYEKIKEYHVNPNI